jgi:hypothetical protein
VTGVLPAPFTGDRASEFRGERIAPVLTGDDATDVFLLSIGAPSKLQMEFVKGRDGECRPSFDALRVDFRVEHRCILRRRFRNPLSESQRGSAFAIVSAREFTMKN